MRTVVRSNEKEEIVGGMKLHDVGVKEEADDGTDGEHRHGNAHVEGRVLLGHVLVDVSHPDRVQRRVAQAGEDRSYGEDDVSDDVGGGRVVRVGGGDAGERAVGINAAFPWGRRRRSGVVAEMTQVGVVVR